MNDRHEATDSPVWNRFSVTAIVAAAFLVAGVAAEGLAGDKSRGQIHRQDGFCWLATGYIVHAGCGYGGQRVFVDPA